jgi:hypothetical protein
MPCACACVLSGAGNQLPVVALDILHVMMAEDKVALVKMNPINDYAGPMLRQVRHSNTGPQQQQQQQQQQLPSQLRTAVVSNTHHAQLL